MFESSDQSGLTPTRTLLAGTFLVRALLTSALFCPAMVADVFSTYQVTIVPTFLPNFYGPGESANQFDSNEFNILGNLPPMFSDIQITFTTTTANLISGSGIVAENFGPNNLTVNMPELNNMGPVPQGNNIVPCNRPVSCWNALVLYNSTITDPALATDNLFLDIADGNFGEGHEWLINLDFPRGASAIGPAISESVDYFDGAVNKTSYCAPEFSGCSATGVQVTPEPSYVWLSGIAGIVLAWCRARGARSS
jgi:hypothetical protein